MSNNTGLINANDEKALAPEKGEYPKADDLVSFLYDQTAYYPKAFAKKIKTTNTQKVLCCVLGLMYPKYKHYLIPVCSYRDAEYDQFLEGVQRFYTDTSFLKKALFDCIKHYASRNRSNKIPLADFFLSKDKDGDDYSPFIDCFLKVHNGLSEEDVSSYRDILDSWGELELVESYYDKGLHAEFLKNVESLLFFAHNLSHVDPDNPDDPYDMSMVIGYKYKKQDYDRPEALNFLDFISRYVKEELKSPLYPQHLHYEGKTVDIVLDLVYKSFNSYRGQNFWENVATIRNLMKKG
jgi:hypothetical protein